MMGGGDHIGRLTTPTEASDQDQGDEARSPMVAPACRQAKHAHGDSEVLKSWCGRGWTKPWTAVVVVGEGGEGVVQAW